MNKRYLFIGGQWDGRSLEIWQNGDDPPPEYRVPVDREDRRLDVALYRRERITHQGEEIIVYCLDRLTADEIMARFFVIQAT